MISIKCNYEIYNKKLLIIICYLKHWRFELKFTNISIKIFSDHKTLKTFITSKNLIRRQARWIKILFEYNFKIIYQFNSCNVKTNAFTRFSKSISKSENNARIKQQYQIILTPNRLKIRTIKINSNLSLYLQVMKANKTSDEYSKYRIALIQNKKKFKKVKLIICTIKYKVLYYSNRV